MHNLLLLAANWTCILQVAHFYNSIDQQMIQSQRPMMLQSALAFEQIIKVSESLLLPDTRREVVGQLLVHLQFHSHCEREASQSPVISFTFRSPLQLEVIRMPPLLRQWLDEPPSCVSRTAHMLLHSSISAELEILDHRVLEGLSVAFLKTISRFCNSRLHFFVYLNVYRKLEKFTVGFRLRGTL